MQIEVPPGTTALSQEAWRVLLSQHIVVPEVEPPVRRLQRRYCLLWGSWRLHYHGPGGEPVEASTLLLNAALAGVMVRSRRELPLNLAVVLTFCADDQECALPGVVAHCTETVGGFKLGIRLRFALPPEPETQ